MEGVEVKNFFDSEESAGEIRSLLGSGYTQVYMDAPPPGCFLAYVFYDGGVRIAINHGEHPVGSIRLFSGPIKKKGSPGRWNDIVNEAMKLGDLDVLVVDLDNQKDSHRLCIRIRNIDGLTAFERKNRLWVVKEI